jgi:hypothetical protein
MFGKQQAQLHVVLAIASQPVELVDNDVADVRVFLDVRKQPLKFRPVGGPGCGCAEACLSG